MIYMIIYYHYIIITCSSSAESSSQPFDCEISAADCCFVFLEKREGLGSMAEEEKSTEGGDGGDILFWKVETGQNRLYREKSEMHVTTVDDCGKIMKNHSSFDCQKKSVCNCWEDFEGF